MDSQETLQSKVSSFEPEVKLFVCVAAKVSTIHALSSRYPKRSSEVEPPLPSPIPQTRNEGLVGHETPVEREALSARREDEAEEDRVDQLRKESATEVTGWLALVCQHFGIDLASLPDDPDTDLRLPATMAMSKDDQDRDPAERRKRRQQSEFEIIWELCLVSLGLLGEGSQASQSKPSSLQASPLPLEYTALSRSLIIRTARVLAISDGTVFDAERAISQFLFFQLQARARQETPTRGQTTDWDAAAQRYKEAQAKKGSMKWAATGAGFLLGSVAIGLTGGLAAPVLAPVLAGTLGIAAFSGASGAVLIGALLGLGGGGLAGYRTHRRMKGLDAVTFSPLKDDTTPQIPSLTATIVASGFLLGLADSSEPWLSTCRQEQVDAYALRADPQTFLEAGKALESFLRTKLITMGGTELVKRTALATVYAGVALPLTIYNTTSLALDSDFTRCKDKAKKAGILLAEILEKEVQGKRPVTLIGYGPGASLVFACLEELHLRKVNVVYEATLISLPEAPSALAWERARSVVAHELVNVYSRNDWVLAIAARLFTLSSNIAGLAPVLVEGVANVDISDIVPEGHLEIRSKLPQILDRVKRRHELPNVSKDKGEVDPDRLKELRKDLQTMSTGDARGK